MKGRKAFLFYTFPCIIEIIFFLFLIIYFTFILDILHFIVYNINIR
uniref:Uncharacterized protein n=1 Tax=Phage sp. cty4N14 TaxID=2825799 RepID=A0A8S5U4R5_9VIRU|nr:MAG TPA: hypothetical protein [Phage sp. cty4N14]